MRRERLSKRASVVAALAGAGLLAVLAGRSWLRAESGRADPASVAFDVSPDGRSVVFSSAAADLFLLDLKTRRVRRLTRSVALEAAPAFSPDGKSVAYAFRAGAGGGAGICVRSLDGTQTRQLTDGLSALDATPSYSGDGRRITFVRASRHRPYSMGGWTWDRYDVYVMNRDGSGLRRVTRRGYYQASHPHFVGGGKGIIFAATGDYPDTHTYLFSAPADGSRPATEWMPPIRALTTSPLSGVASCAVWGCDPSLTPDGKRMVFVSDRAHGFDYDLWVTDLSGGPRPLGVTGVSAYNQEPVFTKDGGHILYLAGTGSDETSRPILSLWEINQDGTRAHRVADSGLFTDPSHWKPSP